MKFGSKKAIFGVIWGGFEGFGPCLGNSHPTHPHLGKISQKKTFFFFGSFPKLTVDHCYQDLPGSGVEKPQQHFLLEGAVHSVSGHLYNCQFPVLDVKLGGYHPPQICYLDIGGSLKVR